MFSEGFGNNVSHLPIEMKILAVRTKAFGSEDSVTERIYVGRALPPQAVAFIRGQAKSQL